MKNKYPIYVISKGRWESRLTVKALEKLNAEYHVVIEPQEFDQYASVIPEEKIKILPFSNLGLGSIPARNWVWENSIERGFPRHWIMDDNIREFYRLTNNIKYRLNNAAAFRCVEDFSDRFINCAMSGLQYEMFCARKSKHPPLIVNTRIYSCILIDNAITHRWRGRYNEDTDLSLRVLKDGKCTFLFQAFLADKMATMRMKGGNTDQLYKQDDDFDGRLAMANHLKEQHPDCVKVVWKWGRWQHSVDYSSFRKNRPIYRPDFKVPEGSNNYGMKLIEKS